MPSLLPRLILVTDRRATDRDLLEVVEEALGAVSTHAPGEAAAGADFALFGPVWETPSKAGAQGEARLQEAVRAAAIPVLAIGGVTAARVPAVRAAGVAGVAVIRAILAAPDPGAATRALPAAPGW